jgi:hypothetical protein
LAVSSPVGDKAKLDANIRSLTIAASAQVQARSLKALLSASLVALDASRKASSAYCRNTDDSDMTNPCSRDALAASYDRRMLCREEPRVCAKSLISRVSLIAVAPRKIKSASFESKLPRLKIHGDVTEIYASDYLLLRTV